MQTRVIADVLWQRRVLARHDRWSRERLMAFQARELRRLRQYAYAHSTFYRRFHEGLFEASLAQLPILTKSRLMDDFDDLVTHPDIELEAVRKHVEELTSDECLASRYFVAATSGTTGKQGLFVADKHEWATVLASYERPMRWAGVRTGVFHHKKLAVVSSRLPWHQSARVAATANSPFLPALRLDANTPLPEIVTRLNEYQPQILVGYAGMMHVLAEQQLSGDLRVTPEGVFCSSELLTPTARMRIAEAWGKAPRNVYAATETSGIASECEQGVLHLHEDLLIVESVDDEYRAVPAGEMGDRLLVTVLFNRTQPLIRYEMTDRIRLGSSQCSCGRPYGIVNEIGGRSEDMLRLMGSSGREVLLHPVFWHQLFEQAGLAHWQVVRTDDGIRVSFTDDRPSEFQSSLNAQITHALYDKDIQLPVTTERVDQLRRTRVGKMRQVMDLSSTHEAAAT